MASVVGIAKHHRGLADVIVVDDGSHDTTAETARNAGAHVIRLARNGGKAEAMEAGVAAAGNATHFLFLDADLIGFTAAHIDALLARTSRRTTMTIGLRDRGGFLTALNHALLPWISGDRLVSRALWQAVPKEFKHGFQIELALNATARRRGDRIATVKLSGLSIVRKEQKIGLIRGLWKRGLMIAELIAVVIKLMLR